MHHAFWLVCALNTIDSFAYFTTRLNLVLFATNEIGMSLEAATMLYGAWGAMCGVAAMFAGPAIDRLGVRRTLLIAGIVGGIGRFGVALSTSPTSLGVPLLVAESLSTALSMPAYALATRALLPDEAPRRFGFSLLYSAMNVGSLAAGLASDANALAELRPFMFVPAAVSIAYVALVVALPPDVELSETRDAVPSLRTLVRDRVFYKLAFFSCGLLGASSVYAHIDTTLVEYLERARGASAHYGLVYAINPLLVIVLSPFVGERTHAYDLYWLVVTGTTLTALAPLALALAPTTPYASSVAFVVALSLGEVVYGPRLPEYALALAPRGLEGTYTTLSTLPLVLVKALVGASSGALFTDYCAPAASAAHCASLWFIVALGAATTPVLLVGARRWLYSNDVRDRVVAKR